MTEKTIFTTYNIADHWGTMWDSVPCEVLSEEWAKINKDLLITEENKNPKMKITREY